MNIRGNSVKDQGLMDNGDDNEELKKVEIDEMLGWMGWGSQQSTNCWLAYGFCFEQLPDTDSLQGRSFPGLVVVSGSHRCRTRLANGEAYGWSVQARRESCPVEGKTLGKAAGRARLAVGLFLPTPPISLF
jgi:hypothetical protein